MTLFGRHVPAGKAQREFQKILCTQCTYRSNMVNAFVKIEIKITGANM